MLADIGLLLCLVCVCVCVGIAPVGMGTGLVGNSSSGNAMGMEIPEELESESSDASVLVFSSVLVVFCSVLVFCSLITGTGSSSLSLSTSSLLPERWVVGVFFCGVQLTSHVSSAGSSLVSSGYSSSVGSLGYSGPSCWYSLTSSYLVASFTLQKGKKK